MPMKEIIFVIIIVLIFIYAAKWELNDRKKIPDVQMCQNVSNYCYEYGKRTNTRYVVKEQIEDESPDILLNRIEYETNKRDSFVYWRMSFFVSVITVFLIYMFDKLGSKIIPTTTYIFIFIVVWFMGYWSRNYLDFHYHDHSNYRIMESIKQIRSKLNI